jgi:hypothetical protein
MNKKQALFTALLFFAATNLMEAQNSFPELAKFTPAQMERLEMNFGTALMSNNTSLVESALSIVTMIKLDRPSVELSGLRSQIEYLASYSRTPSIRYMASIASTVFDSPSKFNVESVRQYSEPIDFFDALAGNSNQTSLTSK